ncbi:hypothetical protein BH09ACT8_BH09ACT8_45570 [soil metagenome]
MLLKLEHRPRVSDDRAADRRRAVDVPALGCAPRSGQSPFEARSLHHSRPGGRQCLRRARPPNRLPASRDPNTRWSAPASPGQSSAPRLTSQESGRSRLFGDESNVVGAVTATHSHAVAVTATRASRRPQNPGLVLGTGEARRRSIGITRCRRHRRTPPAVAPGRRFALDPRGEAAVQRRQALPKALVRPLVLQHGSAVWASRTRCRCSKRSSSPARGPIFYRSERIGSTDIPSR